jgi:hypothetical protein
VAYKLSWYIPYQVLCLSLEGELKDHELQAMNTEVVKILSNRQTPLNLLIDAANLKASAYTAQQLRETQTYINHPKLEGTVVVANGKLGHLVTFIAFGSGQAHLAQFDNFRQAEIYMDGHWFPSTSQVPF